MRYDDHDASQTKPEITAMALSPNRKHLAVAERGEKSLISIYDTRTLKRRRLLVSSELNARDILSMGFSCDGKVMSREQQYWCHGQTTRAHVM